MTMRTFGTSLVAAIAVTGIACRSNDGEIVLRRDAAVRVEECSVAMVAVHSDQVALELSCDAPPNGLAAERWWGAGERPGAFSLAPGECVRVRDRYYCLDAMSPPTLVRSFEIDSGGFLLRKPSTARE